MTDSETPSAAQPQPPAKRKQPASPPVANMREPLLDIKNLSVDFRSGENTVHAVKNLSLYVNPGEILALVGESGSGKSVTAHSVLRLLPYPTASHPSGEIWFQGKNLLALPERQLRHVRGNQISMIFQEPLNALNPLHTVEKQIGEVVALHQQVDKKQIRAEVTDLLDKVGIKDPQSRLASYPHQLSGGQRQRVMIAMALANKPDLLIADEPTTALDVTVQVQVLQLLKDLQREFGMSILMITHDLGVVRHMADRVCVMTGGEIVERGDTAEIFETPQKDYTKHLIASEPSGDPVPVASSAEELIKGENIRVWFPIKRGVLRRTVDHIKAVDDVTVNLNAGETVGVVGESGSGKTTLGLALLRLISSTGDITFSGQKISGLKFSETRPLRKDMQIVFQDPFGSLSPRMSIGGIITEGLAVQKLLPQEPQERRALITRALEEVGLEGDAQDRYPHEFSGGQRQRVAIARAIALKPKFIMLDEPTSALDRSIQAQIIDLLKELQSKHGLGYLFISHDLKVVRAIAHSMIVLRNGKVMETGSAEQIFKTPQHQYTKDLISAAFDLRLDTAPQS